MFESTLSEDPHKSLLSPYQVTCLEGWSYVGKHNFKSFLPPGFEGEGQEWGRNGCLALVSPKLRNVFWVDHAPGCDCPPDGR